jgi:hypothetical protein
MLSIVKKIADREDAAYIAGMREIFQIVAKNATSSGRELEVRIANRILERQRAQSVL